MVHRDPNTGQFVGGDGDSLDDFDDVEQITGRAGVRLGNSTASLQGLLEVCDLDEIVDRRAEIAVMIGAYHRLVVHTVSPAGNTELTNFDGVALVGTSTEGYDILVSNTIGLGTDDAEVVNTDSMDPVGPPLFASVEPQGKDGGLSAGFGGGYLAAEWNMSMSPVADPVFDARDQIIANIELTSDGTNDDIQAIAELDFQYVFGLVER